MGGGQGIAAIAVVGTGGQGCPRWHAGDNDDPSADPRAGYLYVPGLAGDVLVEVGGLKVADYGDAVNAFFLLRPGMQTRFKVKRGGAEKVMELTPAIAKR